MAVLLVDDDPKMLRHIAAHLRTAGFEVVTASNAREAIVRAELDLPSLILLDLALPDYSGMDVLRSIREWTSAPIVVVSSYEDDASKVAALDLGADDYVTKPFSMPELLARVRAALRRASEEPETGTRTFTAGRLTIDPLHQQVALDGKEVWLTRTEYALLHYLALNVGKTVTHDQLVERVWGSRDSIAESSLRTFIKQIRRKIEPDPARPRYLVNVAGIGYRLVSPESDNSS